MQSHVSRAHSSARRRQSAPGRLTGVRIAVDASRDCSSGTDRHGSRRRPSRRDTAGAWRLAATIDAHHWLLTAGMSSEIEQLERHVGLEQRVRLALVEHAAAQIGKPLLLERRRGHRRLELLVSHGAPPAVARPRTPSRRALRDRQRSARRYGSPRRQTCGMPTRLQHVAQRRIVPAEHRVVRRQRHDDGVDLVEHALVQRAQRRRPVCARRSRRLDTCRRARRPGRRRCARRRRRRRFPTGPLRRRRRRRAIRSLHAASAPSTGAPVEQHARTGERRARAIVVGSVALASRHVALGLQLPERREQREDLGSGDARNDRGAERDQAPGRSPRRVGARDLAGGDRRQTASGPRPTTARRTARACAPRRRRGTSAPRDCSRSNKHDGRQRSRHCPAHQLTQIEKALVVGVRRARNDDARRVARDAGQCVLDQVPKPAGKMPRLEMRVGRGRRRATLLGRSPARKPAARTISTGTDGHEAPRSIERLASRSRVMAQMTPAARSCSTPAAP